VTDQPSAAAPGPDPAPANPVVGRTWRPRGVILTASVFTAVFVVGAVIGWFALPPGIRAMFTLGQILTLLAILAVMEAVMWLLAGSAVRAEDTGLVIRNGWSRRHLAWSDLTRVRLRPGDPWATAELTARDAAGEPRRAMLFGLQGSEGKAARAAVRDLNAEIARRQASH